MRLKGVMEGWTGVLLTLVLGVVVVGGGLALAVYANRDYAGVDPRVFDEPGGVALPGELECSWSGTASPVDGPGRAVASIALREGRVLVADDAGGLWRGDPASGALERFADAPDVGGVEAVGRNAIRRHAFVAGPSGLAAVDVATGETVSAQPMPDELSGGVAAVVATTRRVYLLDQAGQLFQARWAYERLDALERQDTYEPLPPVGQVVAAVYGNTLLLVTDGPLLRLAVETGRTQQLPVGEVVPATGITQGPDGLLHLVDGEDLRVLDLNERWVTGRLSEPVDGWANPASGVTASTSGLLLTAPDGTLALADFPDCNRLELTRLDTDEDAD